MLRENILERIYFMCWVVIILSIPILGNVSITTLSFAVFILGLISWLYALLKGGKNIWQVIINSPYFYIVLLIIAVLFLSSFASVDPGYVIKRAAKVSAILVFASGFFVVMPYVRPIVSQTTVRFLPWVLGATALVMLVEYFFQYPLYSFVRGEPSVLTKLHELNPSAVLQTLLIWPILLIFYHHEIDRKALSIGFFILILAAQLILFSSQAALLGLVVGGFAFLLTVYAPNSFPKATFILIGIAALLSPVLAEILYQWKPPFFEYLRSSAAAPQRIDIWHACVMLIKESPVFGYGLDATRVHADNILVYTQDYKWKEVLHPHNFALQLWLDTGVFGVLLFLSFLKILYNKLMNLNLDARPYAMGILLSVISVASVGYSIWNGWFLSTIIVSSVFVMLIIGHARK